jgi:putative membrane protein
MRFACKLAPTACVLALTTFLTAAGAGAAGSVSVQDKAFMTTNAQTNLAEISTARIALQLSDAAMHDLAQTILDDHVKAQRELRQTARSLGFVLPSKPNAAQLAQAQKLKTVGATEFDQTYLQMQALGHRTSIANTQTEIREGTNRSVVAYAKRYLRVAQAHLGMLNQAITGGRFAATPVPPPSPAGGSATPVVTTGPLAHGAKTSPSSDTGWLIGLGAVIVLGIGALMLRLRSRAKPDN